MVLSRNPVSAGAAQSLMQTNQAGPFGRRGPRVCVRCADGGGQQLQDFHYGGLRIMVFTPLCAKAGYRFMEK